MTEAYASSRPPEPAKVNILEQIREYLHGDDLPPLNDANDPQPPKKHTRCPVDIKSPLTDPPGLVGELAAYIYKSSRKPVKSFAIAGALATLSHVNRNYHFVEKSDTALNLYQVLVGETGSGKEDPRRAIKRLSDAASNHFDSVDSNIIESVSSGAAMLRALNDAPNATILVDEFGLYLQNALSDRGSIHQKDLIKDLMILFGCGRSFFSGKVYADPKQNITRISSPYVNLLGTTTPVELFGGINAKMIDNGLLNRLIVVQHSGEQVTNRSAETRVPVDLRDKLLRLSGIGLPVTGRPPKALNYAKGAHERLVEVGDWIEACDDPMRNLRSRSEEHIIRTAGLLAIGDGFLITKEHVDWAAKYVLRSANDFGSVLNENLTESDFHRQANKALGFIQNAKQYQADRQFSKFCERGYMPAGKLLKLMKIKRKDLNDIVDYLIASDQIGREESAASNCFYVL